MRYLALACDYDGTVAHHGRVDEETIAALKRLREAGRFLILVTGRELPDLLGLLPEHGIFHRIVAENGAVVYCPETKQETVLGEPPPRGLVEGLTALRVTPLSIGRVILATWEPHETTVLELIKELGLELQVVFNKGAVMVLPSGVNKATGLRAALQQLHISAHNVVGVGDAENDHAFLEMCEASVAVENALPALKERADWVLRAARGAGVVELVERMLDDDLRDLEPRLHRHWVQIGQTPEAEPFALPPYGLNVLLTGSSGGGKSTLATAVLERLIDARYQFCLLDPEGDYAELHGAVVIGDRHHAPTPGEIFELVKTASESVIVNLLGVPLDARPTFYTTLISRLSDCRISYGRPHWIFVDEVHHMLRRSEEPRDEEPALRSMKSMFFITVHPELVAESTLRSVDMVMTLGAAPERMFAEFAKASGKKPPRVPKTQLERSEVLVWDGETRHAPLMIQVPQPRGERRRHQRKYAQGELVPEESFYFRGANAKLNLRAQNLHMFLQIAEGVDDETWMFHLQSHEYSAWFRDAINDEELAAEAEQIERDPELLPGESRARIRSAVERRYTLPA